MKILVLGLDGADPELLLGDDQLTNIRGLMEAGCYGRLESIIPPITVPALDLHGNQPRPRLARCLRLPRPR